MARHSQRDDLDEEIWAGQFAPAYPAGVKLQRIIKKILRHLFVFVTKRAIPAANNGSGRALRPCAVFRKITNGFRTQWGAKLYADIRSVIETARRRAIRAQATVVNPSQRQKTPGLIGIARLPRQKPQSRTIEIIPQQNRRRHGKLPGVCHLESDRGRFGTPQRVMLSGTWYYRSATHEEFMEKNGFVSHVHRKKPKGRVMPEAIRRANNAKSKIRSKVEHVFAEQKDRMGLFIRTIGIARVKTKIGLANLLY